MPPKPAAKSAAKPSTKAPAAKPAAKATPKTAPKPTAKATAPAAKAPAKKATAGTGNGVYVKGLGDASVAAVKELFKAAGTVTDVRLRRNSFALVFFDGASAVKKAVDTFDKKEVKGKQLSVTAARTDPKTNPAEGSSVVFVSPLFRQSTSRNLIRALFASCGKIVKLRTYHHNCAFVYFDSAAAAEKAVKDKNGSTYQNKQLLVKASVRSIKLDQEKEAHRKSKITAKKVAKKTVNATKKN